MQTQVIIEEPALVLKGYDFNREGHDVEVSWEDLRKAKVGDSWVSSAGSSMRDWMEEEAVVVYKDDRGCAVRVTTWYIPDAPDAEQEMEVQLLWFEFRGGAL